MTNTASSKFNAQRAATRAGLDIATLDFSKDDNGRWGWAPKAPVVDRTPVVSPDGGAAWRALYDGKTPKPEPVEDTEVAPAPAPKAPRGKSGALVAAASSPAGITNAEIRALTGWTKLGGFFDAVKRAGLVLRRQREDGDTRWFAEAQVTQAA